MEILQDNNVYNHVCKLCNKSYPTGKSLGGHMRSHVIANAKKNKLIMSSKALNLATVDDNGDHEDEDDDDQKSCGYVLRENPKKSRRLGDAALSNGKQEMQDDDEEWECKQCGKGFHSLKALCGHMSCHSEKEKNFKEQDYDVDDISWSSDSKESHSDNHQQHNNVNINSSDFVWKRQTRSSLSRHRSVTAGDCGGGSGSGSGGGGSSSNQSEIDQLEQEEVALCLMMLSRDTSGYRAPFNFGAESSDDSVILGGGSFGGRRIKGKNKINQVIVVANKGVNVMNDTQEIDNSDSGYFENGAKELESDDSVDGFVRNYRFKKPKINFGSKVIGDSFYNDKNISKKIMKHDSIKNNNNNGNSIKKGSRYECSICDRTFKTHQALGGHIISHRKSGYKSLDTSISAKQLNNSKNMVVATSTKAKKFKGSKCPYCPRVFKSGQALGGHKRTHTLYGGSRAIVNLHMEAEKSKIEERVPPPPALEPQPHQQAHLIDLNLPASMED